MLSLVYIMACKTDISITHIITHEYEFEKFNSDSKFKSDGYYLNNNPIIWQPNESCHITIGNLTLGKYY